MIIQTSGVRMLVAVLGVGCATGITQASTWHVPADFPSIQEAINAASNGDDIIVGEGTWHEHLECTKSLRIASASGAQLTTIHGDWTGRILFAHSIKGSLTLEGLTLEGGNANNITPGWGGAIWSKDVSLTIADCVLIDNSARDGGAIFIDGGDLVMTNSALSSNFTSAVGGAILIEAGSCDVSNSSFFENVADFYGGAIGAYGFTSSSPASVSLNQCVLASNGSGGTGGAIGAGQYVTLDVSQCQVNNNWANDGGDGIYLNAASVTTQVFDSSFRRHDNSGIWNAGGGDLLVQDCDFCESDIDGPWSDGGGNTFIGQCSENTWWVPGDFSTIQAAIEFAGTGDEILIAAGTYNENLYIDKTLVLRSLDGAATTIVDADGTGRPLTILEGSPIIEGLTFTGGNTGNGGYGGYGGYSGYGGLGGGVLCYYSTPTLTDCTISGNTSDIGGGIYIEMEEDAGLGCQLQSCLITNNVALHHGGGVMVIDSWPSTVHLFQCTIDDNHAAGSGGGVACDQNAATIDECTISNNSAGGDGGGISAMGLRAGSQYEDLVVTNCTISFNTAAGVGGGIVLTDAKGYLASARYLLGPAAPWTSILTCSVLAGLIVRRPRESNSPSRDSSSDRLRSTSRSLAPFTVIAVTAAMSWTWLSPSMATTVGTTPQGYGGDWNALTLLDSHLEGNVAAEGGGVWLDNQCIGCPGSWGNAIAKIWDCTFVDNSAHSGSGGGVSLGRVEVLVGWGEDGIDRSIRNCVFQNNHASSSGGGLSVGSLDVAYYPSDDDQDLTWSLLHACDFSGNSSTDGGGAYLGSVSGWSNTGNGVLILADNCQFTGNNASSGSGGGVHLGSLYADCSSKACTIATFSNCTLGGNAAALGGSLYIEDASFLNVQDCDFTNNNGGYGPGIYVSYSDIEILRCLFSDNDAAWEGGGIMVYDSTATISDCDFINNEGEERGGAISTNYSVTRIDESMFCGSEPEHVWGYWIDYGGNSFEEFCDGSCAADFSGDGDVGINDLLMLLDHWGPCRNCDEDLDNNDVVGVSDLLLLLAAWGACG